MCGVLKFIPNLSLAEEFEKNLYNAELLMPWRFDE